MSTTATQFDIRDILTTQLDEVTHLYLVDLKNVPANKLTTGEGGVTRSPLNFTGEVIGFNKWATGLLTNNPLPQMSDEEREAFYKTFTTLEQATTALQQSVNELKTAIKNCTDETLAKDFPMYWGENWKGIKLACIPAMHIQYHCGQLNYIHMLNGDNAVHWMDQ